MSPEVAKVYELREGFKDMRNLPTRMDVMTAFPGQYKPGLGYPDRAWLEFVANNRTDGYLFYEFLTKEYVDALADYINSSFLAQHSRGSARILEVGAGSGRLAHFLRQKLSAGIQYVPTDDGTWEIEQMFEDEKVERLSYEEALQKYNPDMVISSWMPGGQDWTADFRKNPSVQEFLLIGDPELCGKRYETYMDSNGFEGQDLSMLSSLQICFSDDTPIEAHKSKTYSFRRCDKILL